MMQDPKLPFASHTVAPQPGHRGLVDTCHGTHLHSLRAHLALLSKNGSNKIAYLFASPLFCIVIVANEKGWVQETIQRKRTGDTGGEVKKRVWISSINVEEDVWFVAG